MTHTTAEEAFVFPASFVQRRLWFLEQVEGSAGAYNVSFALRFRGEIDARAMAEAFECLEGRHEILRTTFAMEDGELSQVVRPPRPFPLRVESLEGPTGPAEETVTRQLRLEASAPFDLRTGPLVRAVLFRLAPSAHVLVITMHHAVVDAWSIEVMVRELAAAYAGSLSGRPAALEPLPIQYADYTVWQVEGLSGQELEGKLEYWRRQLAGPLPVLELPTHRARPLAQTYHGARISVDLGADIAGPIRRLARESNATLFMTLLATFQVFLHRHSGQTDLITGTPIAARNQPETVGLIGCFLNTLAIRSDLSGGPTFREALARVRRTVLDAYAEQDLPFEKLVEALRLPRNWSRHPLFQSVFVLHELAGPLPEFSGLEAERLPSPRGDTSKFDLLLSISDCGGSLRAEFEYNSDLFDRATIERMAARYHTLLGAIGADADRPISTLELLPEPERRLLESWAGIVTPYPRDATVPDLFESQARNTPEAVAVASGEDSLTYRALDERANRLAHHLRGMGVGPGTPVGICMERSAEMAVGLLGILKAGGAYVPLDPNYPVARLAMMIEEAGLRTVVTREKLTPLLPEAIRGESVARLDSDWPAIAGHPATAPARGGEATDLAYVMFTSGSTGRPKGVAVPHRGIVRLVVGADFLGPGAFTRVLCYAPISFDASTFELWGPLLNGGTAVVFPAHAPTLAELGRFIERERVETVWLTAALFHQMVEAELERFAQVKYLLAGGDVLSPGHAARVLARFPDCHLINGYGPTENTTFTCCHRITSLEQGATVPIGRPIANTTVHLLDESGSLAPIGVAAELHAGGDGLALGYYNQPGLTAEQFVRGRSGPTRGERLYRTGDRARWRPDGTLEFLGRLDDQVKIRGYRIEPGEIRSVLEAHPAVAQAAVVVRGGAIVAYVVPRTGAAVTDGALLEALRQQLPAFMLPAGLVRLPALPLTAAGKLDRDALPAPGLPAEDDGETDTRPRSTLELALISLWESLLDRKPIGLGDDFFAMGGHSLLAARMVDELERFTGLRLPLAALFRGATVQDVAEYLFEHPGTEKTADLIEVQRGQGGLPFFMAHGDFGGGGFYCREIARAAGPERPVYALAPHRENGADGNLTIEAMAAHHLTMVRRVQPKGPYLLGGYCVSGLVAFEMAQQLTAAGERVDLLLLVDCVAVSTRPRWLAPLLRVVSRLTTKREAAYLHRFSYLMQRARIGKESKAMRQFLTLTALPFQAAARRVARLAGTGEAAGSPEAGPPRFAYSPVWNLHRRAMLTYLPRRYPARIDLILSREMAESFADPAAYWRSIAAELVVQVAPSTHAGVVLSHLPALAEAAIARALTRPA